MILSSYWGADRFSARRYVPEPDLDRIEVEWPEFPLRDEAGDVLASIVDSKLIIEMDGGEYTVAGIEMECFHGRTRQWKLLNDDDPLHTEILRAARVYFAAKERQDALRGYWLDEEEKAAGDLE